MLLMLLAASFALISASLGPSLLGQTIADVSRVYGPVLDTRVSREGSAEVTWDVPTADIDSVWGLPCTVIARARPLYPQAPLGEWRIDAVRFVGKVC